jgi:hypothetical protein
VLVVGENVGGLPVTIALVQVMFHGPRVDPGLGVVVPQTEVRAWEIEAAYTGKLVQVPELPYVLESRRVLQVPMDEQWLQPMLASHNAESFVLRLQDDTGVNFDSAPIRVDRFYEDCPVEVQGASDTAPARP